MRAVLWCGNLPLLYALFGDALDGRDEAFAPTKESMISA